MLSPKRMRRCRAARAVVSTRAARRLTDVAPLDPAHPMPLADALRVQAKVCRQMGAPFYSALSERLAGDVDAGGPTATLLAAHRMTTVEAAVPLRLLGGVHRLVLAGLAPELSVHFPSTGGDGDAEAAWPALRALLADPPPLVRGALGRCAALVGGFLVVARDTGLPLRVRELGASAGLHLRFDRYWYEADGVGFGDPASPVRFLDLWDAGRPPLATRLVVADRRGCDRAPIDPTTDEGRLTLLAYVWPDQPTRLATLRAALAVARDFPVTIDRGEIPGWLRERLREPVEDRATVVVHSITWQYLRAEERADVAATLAAAGARATGAAPLAWLRLEPAADPAHTDLRLTVWPRGEERLLATAGYHWGRVRWLA